jgi:hypothetical protein
MLKRSTSADLAAPPLGFKLRDRSVTGFDYPFIEGLQGSGVHRIKPTEGCQLFSREGYRLLKNEELNPLGARGGGERSGVGVIVEAGGQHASESRQVQLNLFTLLLGKFAPE